jgi:putative glutamine amidotransferase
MRPLIGIPPCLDEQGRWNPRRSYQYLDTSYARALEAAGGLPVYLPLQGDAEALLERLDGLLLPGGDDFPPPRPYPPGVRFQSVSKAQLEFDGRLLAGALARRLPLLAICYGMQLLALEGGGRLHYDLATDLPGAGEHRLDEATGRHGLRLEAGTRLARLLGADPGPVNSLHHQAVSDPGRRLRVAARSEDGLIEALERPGEGFCIGVQWHPEKLEGPHRERLFGAFVEACRGR